MVPLSVAPSPSTTATDLVEAPVRIAVTVMTGLTAVITGALLRTCVNTGVAARDMADAWCSKPHAMVSSAIHAHCAGCGFIVGGLTLLVVALIMAMVNSYRLAAVRVRR
jgi:hypothetical protein